MSIEPVKPPYVLEWLDHDRFRSGVAVREQDRHVAVVDAELREKMVPRDLVMIRYPDRRPAREQVRAALEALADERSALGAELDMELLWGVVSEQSRSFSAAELAALFFGKRSAAGESVMLEALLNDRVYFSRRHMEFLARAGEQVDRMRLQAERVRARSDDYRNTVESIRRAIAGASIDTDSRAALVDELSKYMKNPFARSRETTAMLEQAVSDIDPAEAAYEVLERLGARPSIPRFAIVGGLRRSFSADAENEAASISPRARERADVGYSITIDDAETVEVDDALSCEALDDGRVRARIHIALVADFVPFGGAIDREAAARATTVYLPETTVRMLPDAISCERASLLAGVERPVLTTEVVIGPDGNLLESRIYPALIPISARLDYDRADAILADSQATGIEADTVRTLNRAASALRERRRNSGASLTTRREAKVRVVDDEISIEIIDTSSPARVLVAEFMVLSNSVAARYAAENRIPMIYRVQPEGRFDAAPQRPRLSLFPEHHAGVGMDYYSQLSSPIRRYADLALQRQILTSVSGETLPYNDESLMTVLAGAENAEETGRDLERRAKRYWILRYLERQVGQNPLRASILREGSTAELIDFTVRGTLHNAPMLPNQSDVIVRIARVDPLRGWLSFDFVSEA